MNAILGTLWLPVVLPLAAASIGYYLPRTAFRMVRLVVQIVQVVLTSAMFVHVRAFGPVRYVISGWPQGVGIALSMDRLAGILVAMAAWFFLMVLLFNMRKRYADRLFQFLYMVLQTLLIAIFLSGDLFNIYVLLELSTLVVAILIMWKRSKQSIYDGVVYIMINLASMTFMLLGVGMVYRALGTMDLELMALRVAAANEPRALILPYALVSTAVSVKAALFLLFAWLPRAHGAPSAPSTVSAILSGVQVKAGVYLLIRLIEIFGTALPIEPFFLVVGFLTSIGGFILAIAQKDIKLILAYHTVSQVGLIIVGLASGTDPAWWGGVLHMINHAFFKSLLFLTAGIIIHVYGTRDVYRMQGVFRRMPLVSIAMIAAILGITGAPYFNGSVSKYLIQGAWYGDPVELAVYLINLGTAISFVKVARVFFGPVPDDLPNDRRQPDPWTSAVSLAVGLACLAGGVLAAPITSYLFGVELSLSGAVAFEKVLTYLVTLGVAWLFYRFVIARYHPLDRIRDHSFHFNDLVFGMLLYLGATGAYLAIALA
jgi:multicomponent Na+:H+ antiporter subunit D